MSATFRDEIRAKYPALAARAERGPKAAIRMFCIECMGGQKADAKACRVEACFLWPHRGASWKPDSPEGA
ncbi:MAG: hypothetical protein EHM35_01455 [Planctomycetaceae bacterium]|nr:MAG: hypothetical protein EHM35_01455 [Planctomycetaceae bacterium]